MNVLMVAEKPILAETIAKILSDGKCRTTMASNRHCFISEYKANFRGQLANFKVTSTCGHIISLDFPQLYKSWYWEEEDWMTPQVFFSCPILEKESVPEFKMTAHLASVAKNCDILILWLDCDREGENICYEVIDAVRDSMRRRNPDGNFMDRVFRAKFSSIAAIDIKKAMTELTKPNANESISIEIRQELDMRIGCAFTRFLTCHYRSKYDIVDSTLISYGPCQTPTIAFCVNRHDEILGFKPRPFWFLHANIGLPDGLRLNLQWTRDRQFDKSTAQQFLNKIEKCTEATIVEITQTEQLKDKPVALNSCELFRVASNFLRISPNTTMEYAQQLYKRGYASYPRTETTSYPENFEFEPILRELAGRPEFALFANQILTEGIIKDKSGVNKGDHPPITPTDKNIMDSHGMMPADHARVYQYIARHFLATLMRPCRYSTKTVKFSIGEEEFVVHSNVVHEPGFTQILTRMAVYEDKEIADLLDGLKQEQKLPIKVLRLVERMTVPPDYLTESELITLMEQNHIGTDGSIPTHINKINELEYVKLEAGQRLVPTKLGVALVHAYRKVDPDLISPKLRAKMEKRLDRIARGRANEERIRDKTLGVFKQKYENFVENIGVMDEIFDKLERKEMENYSGPVNKTRRGDSDDSFRQYQMRKLANNRPAFIDPKWSHLVGKR